MTDRPPSAPTHDSERRGAPLLLAEMTTDEVDELVDGGRAIALVPVGSTEPHGPHLPLGTDALLSEEVCRRATIALREVKRRVVVAPAIAYGVTRYARGFHGVVGVSEQTLVALVGEVGRGLLDDGFAHVCFVNNHLEPAHVAAIERAVTGISEERGETRVSFPNQLSRKWGRTLSDEFKRGDCHAGRYETSLVLAAREDLVRQDVAHALPTLAISLSEAIKKSGGEEITFSTIGMFRAYTGAPSKGTAAEGDEMYARLVTMIVTELNEHLDDPNDKTPVQPSSRGGRRA